jgi:hypothetical protein
VGVPTKWTLSGFAENGGKAEVRHFGIRRSDPKSHADIANTVGFGRSFHVRLLFANYNHSTLNAAIRFPHQKTMRFMADEWKLILAPGSGRAGSVLCVSRRWNVSRIEWQMLQTSSKYCVPSEASRSSARRSAQSRWEVRHRLRLVQQKSSTSKSIRSRNIRLILACVHF